LEDLVESRSDGEWEAWLARNHSTPDGTWMRVFKESCGRVLMKGSEALGLTSATGG
jgi:hypothetical protein